MRRSSLRLDLYDEGSAEPLAIEIGEVLGGIEGSLNIAHPKACSGLAEAARGAGAQARRGVRDVRIETGMRPSVHWKGSDGAEHETACGLVVGAMCCSLVRSSQAGVELEVDPPPAHLIAGMLVETVDGIQTNAST